MNASVPPSSSTPAQVRRGRLMLITLFLLFFGTVFGAGVLRFAGWQPQGSKTHGEMLQPAVDVRSATPMLADGTPYPWDPVERTWRIVVAPPAGCEEACVGLTQDLDKVWRLFGHRADHAELLWIGTLPQGAPGNAAWREVRADDPLRALLPGVDDPSGIPVYVIDPNGFVILRYAPGSDPGGLRTDVARLLKLK